SRPNSGRGSVGSPSHPRTNIRKFAAGSAYEYDPDTRLTRSPITRTAHLAPVGRHSAGFPAGQPILPWSPTTPMDHSPQLPMGDTGSDCRFALDADHAWT